MHIYVLSFNKKVFGRGWAGKQGLTMWQRLASNWWSSCRLPRAAVTDGMMPCLLKECFLYIWTTWQCSNINFTGFCFLIPFKRHN